MRKRFIPAYLFLFIFLLEANGMSLFEIGKTCVFSDVQLKLLKDGKPLSNVKVTRQWDWNKRGSDHAMTSDDGSIHFPAVFASSVSRLLPTELVIGQQLSIEIDGKEQVIWTNAKREPDVNSEYGGKPFNVVCDLKGEEVLIEDYGSLMVAVCKLI